VAASVAPSLLDLVGSTPLVELERLSPKRSVRIFAKLEGQNPTGSIKDRVATAMIDAAETSGELETGRRLLEPTSGNTGIALALVAKLRGYPLTCGTLMGAGERLRESFPDVVLAAAEPLPGDEVMGLRSLADGYVPPILDVYKLDRKLLVSNAESVAGLRLLLEREGIFGGVSSGAVVHAALRLAGDLNEGVVVCILADGGWKYLSAGFWDADADPSEIEAAMERSVWW